MSALPWFLVGVGAGVVFLILLPSLAWHLIVSRARRRSGGKA